MDLPSSNRHPHHGKLVALLATAVFFASLWTVPVAWCKRGSSAWFNGDLSVQRPLAKTVVAQSSKGLTTEDFTTKDARFNGEWLFGTHLMTGIGLCQLGAQHPESASDWFPAIDRSIDAILSMHVRSFDHAAWGSDALQSLDSNEGHAAYLGYLNFLLGLYRQLHPDNRFIDLNDRISKTLARRLANSANGLVETYPNEWYPMDNSTVVTSIALHGRATGTDYSSLLKREVGLYKTAFTDPSSGLLVQAVNGLGEALDPGRGSGTALSVFVFRDIFPELSASFSTAIRKELASGIFGFGAIREYPRSVPQRQDIDSGPIVFGWGFSATGFSIAAARIAKDEEMFSKLYASAVLAGTPRSSDGRLDFLTAGPLGNAILLAMLTAPHAQ